MTLWCWAEWNMLRWWTRNGSVAKTPVGAKNTGQMISAIERIKYHSNMPQNNLNCLLRLTAMQNLSIWFPALSIWSLTLSLPSFSLSTKPPTCREWWAVTENGRLFVWSPQPKKAQFAASQPSRPMAFGILYDMRSDYWKTSQPTDDMVTIHHRSAIWCCL